jgi:colanic acid biosynthesis glycosyl transferase WcaI
VKDTIPEELLVVTQWYRPELIGTAFYSGDLAEWFAENGSRVTVLTNRPSYPGDAIFPEYRNGDRDREVLNGVAVRRLSARIAKGGGTKARILAEIYFVARGLLALATGRVARSQTVVSFCPSVMAVFLGWIACRRGGQHMAVIHDIQSGLAAGLGMLGSSALLRLIRATERYCLNRADHLVVLSEQMRDALLSLGVKRPIAIVPIWVDARQIFPLPRPEGAPSTILYGGNLGRKQGLEQLLDLAEVLRDERPDIRILIRGGGSQEKSLKVSAQQRGLANLCFEPLLPLDRFNEGLAEGDVHLVPQDPEAADFAVPSKVYNIMAASRPFIATALPGSTLWDLQEQSRALLCVPPNNPRAFADAVIGLIDDPGKRAEMGAGGRAYVEAKVARDVVLRRYVELMTGRPPT